MKFNLTLLVLTLAGCAKEKSCENCVPPQQGIHAIVEYSGEPALDGCDWNLLAGTEIFHPENLDPAFKQHELEVEVFFIPTGDVYTCGFGDTRIPVVHIAGIKKR